MARAQAKAKEEKVAAGAAGKKALKHADAVIIKAFMHCSSKRMEIQGKCHLSDGSYKTIGIVGLYLQNSANFAEIGKVLLAKCNEGSGYTKAEIVEARYAMLRNTKFAD